MDKGGVSKNLEDDNYKLSQRLIVLERERNQQRIQMDNDRLRRALVNAGIQPETEVELAKDLFTPEINGGKYSQYIAKNLGLGNYTPIEAKIILIYQSLIDTSVNEGLCEEPTNLAGFYETKKMGFAMVSTSTGVPGRPGGFLLQNLRTSRGISENTINDLTAQGNQSIVSKLRTKQPQGQV